jgi:hypothetical protein
MFMPSPNDQIRIPQIKTESASAPGLLRRFQQAKPMNAEMASDAAMKRMPWMYRFIIDLPKSRVTFSAGDEKDSQNYLTYREKKKNWWILNYSC